MSVLTEEARRHISSCARNLVQRSIADPPDDIDILDDIDYSSELVCEAAEILAELIVIRWGSALSKMRSDKELDLIVDEFVKKHQLVCVESLVDLLSEAWLNLYGPIEPDPAEEYQAKEERFAQAQEEFILVEAEEADPYEWAELDRQFESYLLKGGMTTMGASQGLADCYSRHLGWHESLMLNESAYVRLAETPKQPPIPVTALEDNAWLNDLGEIDELRREFVMHELGCHNAILYASW